MGSHQYQYGMRAGYAPWWLESNHGFHVVGFGLPDLVRSGWVVQ